MLKNFLASAAIISASLVLPISNSYAEDDLNYEVIAEKLEESRNSLSPETGGSSYIFEEDDIANLPLGQATNLNQLLQRAPGVVVNSRNQFHVRGDHSGIQYRINGVMLPEGINSFGQQFDTHFADEVEFLTGAMPAQYGFRNSAVVDLKTKTGSFAKKNRSEVSVGSNETYGANQQVGGINGNLEYYVNANYLQSSRGIDSTTAARNSINNDTSQDNFLGYFSYLLKPTQKLSLIVSNSTNRFEIPANSGQEAEFELANSTITDSLDLRQKQREQNRFAVASLQGISESNINYQLSLFTRYSDLEFKPDYESLVFNGTSSALDRSSFANGVQGDFSYELDKKNTLRAGFYAVTDRVEYNSQNNVFTGEHHEDEDDDHGHAFEQDSNQPIRVDENAALDSRFYSLYLQNEWKALEDLTLNYGARFDVSQAFLHESQLSPRFNGVYSLTKKTKINFGYARQFTPPSVASVSQTSLDNFEGTSNESEVSSNNKVKAERAHYFDLGVTHKANDYLTLAVDSYYKRSKNYLDEHQFGNSLLYSPFNYARGKSYGVEFKADYKKDNLSAYINFAAQRAYARNVNSAEYVLHEEEFEYAANNWVRLDHVQNYSASVGASYKFFSNVIALDALYGSGLSTGDNNRNTMPSYWQLNSSFSRDVKLPKAGKLNVRVAVINALDEVYQYSNGTGVGVNAAQFAPRRSYFLILSKSF